MTILIRNAATVGILDGERREIRGGWVLLDGGVVAAVGEAGEEPEGAGRVIDAPSMAVLPGFVNTHHHFFQTLTRAYPGAVDAELFDWLRTLYPVWARIDREGFRTAALAAMAELALSGCTTTSDHHYLFSDECADPVDVTIEAAKEIGIRFHATRGSMSLSEKDGGLPPDRVVQDEKTILADCRRVVERYHDDSPGAMVRNRSRIKVSKNSSVNGSQRMIEGMPPQMITLSPQTSRARASESGTIGAVTSTSAIS